ncbi:MULTISPECIES: hypothetical protein [unclassified Streptomyces]|uniref:hypothetical protein n=1 Tax=unclassified Streptomyces TaxID=2593676 RepID=UPI0037A8A02C
MTQTPLDDVLDVVVAAEGGADALPGSLTLDHFLLCELAEHDARTEHAAHLWSGSAEPSNAPALWFFWTGAGSDRVHRVATVPWCAANLRHLDTGVVRMCAFFDHHPAPHSWSVTDPLGDLLAERLVSGDGLDNV